MFIQSVASCTIGDKINIFSCAGWWKENWRGEACEETAVSYERCRRQTTQDMGLHITKGNSKGKTLLGRARMRVDES
jgi:hypothetical protein